MRSIVAAVLACMICAPLLAAAEPSCPTSVSAESSCASAVPLSAAYNTGWNTGWAEGWKYVKGEFSIAPIPPIPPIPEIGRDKYIDGYNRGFVAGMHKAQASSARK